VFGSHVFKGDVNVHRTETSASVQYRVVGSCAPFGREPDRLFVMFGIAYADIAAVVFKELTHARFEW
jgi:hypothetical protein